MRRVKSFKEFLNENIKKTVKKIDGKIKKELEKKKDLVTKVKQEQEKGDALSQQKATLSKLK